MKKTLLFFLILGVSFFVCRETEASQITQSIADVSVNYIAGGVNPRRLNQTFTAVHSGTTSQFSFPAKIYSGTSPVSCLGYIRPKGSSSNLVSFNTSDCTPAINSSAQQTVNCVANPARIFGSLTAGNQYIAQMECSFYAGNYIQFYGASSDVYSGGVGASTTPDYGTTMVTTDGLYDFAFQYQQTDSDSYIEFASTPTSTCDFQYWPINLNLTSADETYCKSHNCSVVVRFGADSFAYESWFKSYGTLLNVSPNAHPDVLTVTKQTPIPSGFAITAQAVLYDNSTDYYVSTGHILKSSDVWTYIISPTCTSTSGTIAYPDNTPVFTYLPTATSSSWGDNLTCDTNSSWFDKSMCNFWLYLLRPDPAVLQNWTELKTTMETKPPFGYISVFVSTTRGFTTTTATTSVDYTWGPKINVLVQFRNILTWILWLIFGIWVIKRLSNFSLHG